MARANAEETLRLEAERRARLEAQARSIAEARLEAEMELHAEAERKDTSRGEGVSPSKRGRDARDTGAPAMDRSLKRGLGFAAAAENNGRTATCEGCGRDGVPEHDLRRIESGQLVCPDCMVLTSA